MTLFITSLHHNKLSHLKLYHFPTRFAWYFMTLKGPNPAKGRFFGF